MKGGGQSFTIAAGPRQRIFYYLRFETSLFVASYETQGYGGDIRAVPQRRHRLQQFLCCSSTFPACLYVYPLYCC
jgi:hypothetical protein